MKQVVANDGTQVGKISKQWSGFAREVFTDSDHFGINFPMDLDVRVKATLLGCLFLIVCVITGKPLASSLTMLCFVLGLHVFREIRKQRR